MYSNFTKMLFTAIAAFAMVFTAAAQSVPQFSPLKIRINNPEAKGIEFKVLRANFGPRIPAGSITADLVVATDGVTAPTDNDTWSPTGFYGCEALTNGEEINGKIAIVGRGVCEFGVKIRNAETQGAVATIITNRAPIGLTVGTHTDGIVWMGAGVVGDSTTTPGMFMTYEDWAVLDGLMGALGTLNATILNSYMYDAAVSYAYGTPESNVRTLDSMQLVLINRDTVDIFDITVTATITTPGGSTETLTATVDTLAVPAADASGETQVFFDGYTPSEVGLYTVVFTAATAAGDTPLDAESLTMEFEVTDDYTFRLDDGDINENASLSLNVASYQGPANLIFNVGALYRAGAEGSMVNFASFVLTNPADLTPGMQFVASIHTADPDGDGNFDNNADGIIDALDFEEVASATYEVSGEEEPFETTFIEFGSPVSLDANQTYLLMVSHDGLEDDNFFPPAFAVAGTQNHANYGNVFELAFPGADTYQFELDGFEWWNDDTPSLPHGGLRPVIRMHEVPFVPVGTKDLPLLDEGKFMVIGNPASELLQLGFQLDNPAEEVNLVIVDQLGRVLSAKRLENVLNETHIVDIRGLAAGPYMVTAFTPEGFRTKIFVVAR